MNYKVRRFIRSTPFLYRNGKRLKRNLGLETSGRLCQDNTDLCVEAYPSSANSFTYELIQEISPELEIAHHCHAIANVKIALRNKVPTIVLIRPPSDCIPSRIARFNVDSTKAILEYINFYKFVFYNRQDLAIITFSEITEKTEQTIRKIEEKTDINLEYRDDYNDIEELQRTVFQKMRKWERKHGDMDKVSLPSSKRKPKKEKIQKRISKHPKFEETQKLYNKITNEN